MTFVAVFCCNILVISYILVNLILVHQFSKHYFHSCDYCFRVCFHLHHLQCLVCCHGFPFYALWFNFVFFLYARWHPFYPSVLLQCWLHFVCLDFLWLCASVSSAGKLQCIFLDNCCNSKMYFAIYRLPSCVQAQRASYRLEGCVFNFLNYSDSSQKVLFTKKLTLLMSALIAQIYKSSATWIFAFCEFTPEIF